MERIRDVVVWVLRIPSACFFGRLVGLGIEFEPALGQTVTH